MALTAGSPQEPDTRGRGEPLALSPGAGSSGTEDWLRIGQAIGPLSSERREGDA